MGEAMTDGRAAPAMLGSPLDREMGVGLGHVNLLDGRNQRKAISGEAVLLGHGGSSSVARGSQGGERPLFLALSPQVSPDLVSRSA
jgi:hypothetical protein